MTEASKSPFSTAIELVGIIAAALVLALAVQAFLVKPYRIPSGSMLPTVRVNQRVLVNRLALDFSSPHVGDIIVFHPPHGADFNSPVCGDPNQGTGHTQACDTHTPQESTQTFIKRVVAGPGDRLFIRDGHVYRNGVKEQDSYTAPCGADSSCNFPKPITVPPGEYFMMGDNRGLSDDSRFWGPVPDKWVIGVAFFTYWPPDRIGTI